eukprot:CAMPEP_0194299370 /NCGR_PEP_ID=MMETSP0169-20130528/60683_1 /TAXON_ID=218684 /ORGANISM="Corethron pennatum, Strain L29A3" /LENGTH=1148 /DNA_ID=CAMNT_0039049463 /DNA_START=34 /DNA_END=3480 /DNA_ORIENTATION=-
MASLVRLAALPSAVTSTVDGDCIILQRRAESDTIAGILLPWHQGPIIGRDGYGVDEFAGGGYESDDESDDDSDSDSIQERCAEGAIYGKKTVLDVVDDTQPNKAVILGMGGTGKSTLAAIVASRPDIRRNFDTIFWIDVGKSLSSEAKENDTPVKNNLSYEKYRECLRSMCRQLEQATNDAEGAAAAPPTHHRFNEEVAQSPGDRSMQVAAKYLRAMLAARSEMARILRDSRCGNTLLVLDDVWSHEDIDLFNFGADCDDAPPSSINRLSMLITTRTVDWAPLPKTYTLSLGIFNEQDAILLIGLELGLSPYFNFESLPPDDKRLLLEIIRRCGYLPLAIRLLGKALRSLSNTTSIPSGFSIDSLFKSVMMGWTHHDMKQINDITASPPPAYISLYDTLDRTFSMVVTSVESSNFVKRCFGALAVTFASENFVRPWTSLSIVEQLWTAMIRLENDDASYILERDGLCRGDDVRRTLEAVGVIDVMLLDGLHNKKTKCIRISHDLLCDFGKQYLNTNLLPEISDQEEKTPCFSLWPWKNSPKSTTDGTNREPADAITRFFNRQICHLYDKMIDGSFTTCDHDGHMYYFYPQHLMRGNLIPDAYALLTNRDFIACRLQLLGMEDGVQKHMRDIEVLHNAVVKARSGSTMDKKQTIDRYNVMVLINTVVYAIVSFESVVDCMDSTQMLIKKRTIDRYDVMVLVNSVVYAIVSFESVVDCMDSTQMLMIQLENARKARGLLKVGTAVQRLHRWNIAMDCFSKALQYLKFAALPSNHPDMVRTRACIETAMLHPVRLVAKESPDRLVLKYGAILKTGNNCSYAVPLELTSHPGYGIVPMNPPDSDFMASLGLFTYLGIGRSESSMEVKYDGDFITRATDGFVMNVTGGWLYEGVALAVKPGPKNEQEHKKHLKMTNGSRRFLINDEGTISPTNCPDLVLGISKKPGLYLVDRYSPNRARFKNVDQIINSANDKSSENGNGGGIRLELQSHAPYGIVPITKLVTFKDKQQISFRRLGLGPLENALQVIYQNNKIIIRNYDNYLLALHIPGKFAGNSINMFGSTIPNWEERWFFKIWNRFAFKKNTDFAVNDDGTISPLDAPHLALGFQIPDFSQQQDKPVTTFTYDPLLEDNSSERKSISTYILSALSVLYLQY